MAGMTKGHIFRCGPLLSEMRSHAGDFACLDAGGADVQALRGLTHHGANGLDVWVPAALGPHV